MSHDEKSEDERQIQVERRKSRLLDMAIDPTLCAQLSRLTCGCLSVCRPISPELAPAQAAARSALDSLGSSDKPKESPEAANDEVNTRKPVLSKDQILSKIKQLEGDIKKANQEMSHVAVRSTCW